MNEQYIILSKEILPLGELLPIQKIQNSSATKEEQSEPFICIDCQKELISINKTTNEEFLICISCYTGYQIIQSKK